jgi:hypothetical protein
MTAAWTCLLKSAAVCVLLAVLAVAVLACYHPAAPCGAVFYPDGHAAAAYCPGYWGMP